MNRDGKADLLYRHEVNELVYVIRVDGLSLVSKALVYTEPDTAWHVLGPLEYAQ